MASDNKIIILPSDNDNLEKFIKKYKLVLLEHSLDTIEYAIENNLNTIEVFKFQNSDFVVILNYVDYLINLNSIYEYYLKNEMYEFCPRITRLQKILTRKYISNEKETQCSNIGIK